MLIAQQGSSRFLSAPSADDFAPGFVIDLEQNRVWPVRYAGSVLKHGYWDDLSAPENVRCLALALADSYAYLTPEPSPMPTIFVPSRSATDWKPLLAQPERHWKAGYSAMALARAWEEAAPGSFPPEIRAVLEESGEPALSQLRLLLALPEYPVPLPGGDRPSQTDVFALARGPQGLVAIAVEGKVDEPFGPTLGEKRGDASSGAALRLRYLLDALGLSGETSDLIRYQLLHRAVSALLVAEQFAAPTAVLLIHSFSLTDRGFEDFTEFAALFGQQTQAGKLVRLGQFGGCGLWAGWCKGEQRFREPLPARAQPVVAGNKGPA